MTAQPPTDGPWEIIDCNDKTECIGIVGANREHIAEIFPLGSSAIGRSIDEHRANARLIVAAPQLLAALKAMCLEMENSGGAWCDCYLQACAAIAKARGEQP